jgi:hypothetical protein
MKKGVICINLMMCDINLTHFLNTFLIIFESCLPPQPIIVIKKMMAYQWYKDEFCRRKRSLYGLYSNCHS